MKLKQISIVMLKEKTLELEHNQDKYTFCFYFFLQLFRSPFNAFYVSSLYIYFLFLEKTLQASKSIQSKCDIALTFLKWFFVFTFKIETDY